MNESSRLSSELIRAKDFNAVNAGDGKAEAWAYDIYATTAGTTPTGRLYSYTCSCVSPFFSYEERVRRVLIHCSAAVAPWFSPNKFGGGAYLTVDQNVGDLIDWVSPHFYWPRLPNLSIVFRSIMSR